VSIYFARIFVLGSILLSVPAVPVGQQNMNLETFKRDSRIFEGILDELLKQTFSDFSIASEPLTSYMPGYGVVTTFYLKINRMTIRTPFGTIQRPRTASSQTKQEQIRTVKETMMEALANYGATLKGLNPNDHISVCARIEDRNELDPSKNQSVVVLTVTKDDIELYNMKKITLDDFKARVRIIEY